MKLLIRRSLLRSVLSAGLLFLTGLSLHAQSATTGAVNGTVADETLAPIPNIAVTLVSDATGQTNTVTTAANGAYAFNQLAPGTYRIRFSGRGFKSTDAVPLTVNISESLQVDAKLEAGNSGDVVLCTCTVRTA